MPYQTVTNVPTSSRSGTSSTTGCGCGCRSCTTCNSLQCLCRPRFFAGQLITDADFRRLDQYLVGKDRLHNKFLHGSGVVCGLEVVCNPCDDTVTVRPGYALGPCGEDIVVCSDASVPVGTLIRDQRRAVAKTNCNDRYGMTPNDCDALEQRWILAVCYDEQPSRPVATLASSSSKGCGGTCGSSSSAGCGCGRSSSSGTSSSPSVGCGCGDGTTTQTLPAGCEPTVICEGFRFVLTKEPAATLTNRNQSAQPTSALLNRIKECASLLTASITAVPKDPTAAQVVAYTYAFKSELRTIIASSNIHDCTMGQRLSAVVLATPTDENALAISKNALIEMTAVAVDLFRECVCSALLPPCADACSEDCIPLATLTVRSSDLKVLDVCNWSSRKFAVTMQTLGYWLGWIPLGTALRTEISKLCCPPTRDVKYSFNDRLNVTEAYAPPPPDAAAPDAAPPDAAASDAAPPDAAQPEAADVKKDDAQATTGATSPLSILPEPFGIAARYVTDPSPLAGLDASVLAGLGFTGPDDTALASQAELDSPLTALALSRALGPEGADLGSPIRELSALVAPHLVTTAMDDRIATLERTVSSLQGTVNRQAGTITELRKLVSTAPAAPEAPPAKAAAKPAARKPPVRKPPTKKTTGGSSS